MLSTLSSWIEQASDAVKELSNHGAEAVRQVGLLDLGDSPANPEGEEEQAEASTPILALPTVADSPAVWAAAVEEWRFLIDAALADELFCSSHPADIATHADTWAKLTGLLGLDAAAAAPLAASAQTVSAEPTIEMAEWLPKQKAAYKVYAALVPRTLPDEGYWGTVAWKLDLARRCTKPDALLSVLKVLAHGWGAGESADTAGGGLEPEAAVDANLTAVPSVDSKGESEKDANGGALRFDEEYWATAERELRALQETLQWRAALEADAKKEIELASGNLKLLRNLLAKPDMRADLAQSVADSCSYHKVKLAKLIGSVDSEQDRLAGSPLNAMELGGLYTALLEMNKSIQEAMVTFEERKRGPSSDGSPAAGAAAGVRTSPTAGEACVRGLTVAGAETQDAAEAAEGVGESPLEPAHASSPPIGSTGSWAAVPSMSASREDAALEDTSFEANMPWESDGDV